MPQLTIHDLINACTALQILHGPDVPVWLGVQDAAGEDVLAPLLEVEPHTAPDGSHAVLLLGPIADPTPEEVAAARAQDVAETGARQCVGCGCTDHIGCRGGCGWVATCPPLCSTCAAGLDDDSLTRAIWGDPAHDRQRLLR